MNRDKFLQVQESLTAVGDDYDILRYIANDIIYDSFYKHIMTYPNLCEDKSLESNFSNEKLILEHPINIPINVTDYYVNKDIIKSMITERFKLDGWEVWDIKLDYLRQEDKRIKYLKFSLSYKMIKPSILDRLINIFKR